MVLAEGGVYRDQNHNNNFSSIIFRDLTLIVQNLA